MNKYFIYEVQKKVGPAAQEFYCYIIYDVQMRRVIDYFKADTQRASRKECEKALEILMVLNNGVSIWRDWPIVLLPNELHEKAIMEEIRKREI